MDVPLDMLVQAKLAARLEPFGFKVATELRDRRDVVVRLEKAIKSPGHAMNGRVIGHQALLTGEEVFFWPDNGVDRWADGVARDVLFATLELLAGRLA